MDDASWKLARRDKNMIQAKKAIILRTSGNELANQLWNSISVYAYTLERKLSLENPAFFEYGNYFTIPTPNLFLKLFFFLPFTNYTKRKQSFKRRLWRKLYKYYTKASIRIQGGAVLVSDNRENTPFYLPPTSEDGKLSELEKLADTIFFDGWLFRNPVGIQKYRKEIRGYFKPRQDIENSVKVHIKKLRDKFSHVVGVHIRQGDYKQWRGGAYFVPQTRVREILDEYLTTTNRKSTETCFVITSDDPVDASLFNGLNISVSKENAVHDLFLLSSTDIIIGSNSTFGAFASYYGNIPSVVMQKERMNWDYYVDKKTYFENKYSTMVHY